MRYKTTEVAFMNLVKKIEDYRHALGLLNWDSRTGAPKKGVQHRSEVIGTLAEEVFQLSTSVEMSSYLEELSEERTYRELTEKVKKTVDECRKTLKRNENIPKQEFKEYVMLQAQTEALWEEAKEKADFELFRPNLEKLVTMKKRFIDYWGSQGHPYNTLLDDFEPGVFVDTLDDVFGDLRRQLIPIVRDVSAAKHQPRTDSLFKPFPQENQRALSIKILKEIGYDFEAGRLDETIHPFALALSPYDVRVTTNYNENDFRVSLFGTIHEGGHALYEQNISSDLIGTPLCDGTSMGIHESQSLFYEQFIGHHFQFWRRNYKLVKKYASGQFEDVPLEQFYFAINEAKPSLIRIESDELTYCLHIIFRYELEKALFGGEIEVGDLPHLWNEKMEAYLGIRPEHDGEGVLQDSHWSSGAFGYFPSYALGYIYAAQMKEAMVKDVPDFDQLIFQGNFDVIGQWFKINVHQFGKLKKPDEIIKDVTGGEIDSGPLVRYLEQKYRALYQV